jgi:hypothetical protein
MEKITPMKTCDIIKYHNLPQTADIKMKSQLWEAYRYHEWWSSGQVRPVTFYYCKIISVQQQIILGIGEFFLIPQRNE